ncbi:MAG: hypothetical protein ACO3HF_00960 [Burkholderiaceae bacterium]
MEDYDRNNFQRGSVVIVDMTTPSGSVVRHPRGYLYVIATSYEPESDSLVVEVGCRLALAALTEDIEAILPLVPVPLDPAQETYQNIAASFSAAGKYIYQDNQGAFQVGDFFDGDSTASVAAGEWVSVLGVTTLQAAPLAGAAAIPDEVRLTYQVPSDGLASDESGKIEENSTTSYYFTQYPAITYVRKQQPAGGGGGGPEPQPPAPTPIRPILSNGCGNTPPPPDSSPSTSPSPGGGGEVVSCSQLYETRQQATYAPVTRIELSRTIYNGPSGQVGYTYKEVRGPLIEANGQYFADKYAYCRGVYGNQCSPNGGCPYDGLGIDLLQYETQYNTYGPANELIRSVRDTYVTRLSGAQPTDWRAGIVNGVATTFSPISSGMYRLQRVETTYQYNANQTVQDTLTYTSSTSRGSGIKGGNIDALSGIRTRQRRVSTTISANPVTPDLVNTVTTATTERDSTILLFSDRYLNPPSEAGPYRIEEQLPVPVLFENESQIQSIVDAYSQYLEFFIKGDAFGMQVSEVLRDDIMANWRPGMPFRYYDPKKGKIMAMRMDATTWGISGQEAVMTTNGIFLGLSNGSIQVPRNLTGDSRPDMGGGVQPPAPSGGAPSVVGETTVNQGNMAWVVNINIAASASMNFWGGDGVLPTLPSLADSTFTISTYATVWCSGIIVQAGQLLDTNDSGGIPLEYNGNLVVADATVVDGDVFA